MRIYLMKELVDSTDGDGLRASPIIGRHSPFAAGSGKAIYNDVDQVYLATRENCLMLILESMVFWRSPMKIHQSC